MFTKKPVETDEAQPQRRFTDEVRQLDTLVGTGIHLKGEITGKANVEILGTIDGQAELEGLCHIKHGGKFIGDINANHVVIEGEVQGNVQAKDKVELRTTAQVKGNIRAEAVCIAEGSYFEGQVQMQGKDPGKHFSFAEKRDKGSKEKKETEAAETE